MTKTTKTQTSSENNAAASTAPAAAPPAASAKPKLALCVESAHLPLAWSESKTARLIPIPEDFWNIQTRLVDRKICETDSSTQQLLPYNVLVDEDGNAFTYSRGKGGEEARLHAKTSIGIGGHVDGEVPKDVTLFQWLIDEARRETVEEVGLTLTRDPVFTHFIVDRDDDVGSVHIGLLSVNRIERSQIAELEADVIEHTKWTDYLLASPEEIGRLENWSRIIVEAFRAGQLAF